jgi:hypothetical protein
MKLYVFVFLFSLISTSMVLLLLYINVNNNSNPNTTKYSESELIFLYIGDSSCQFCHDADTIGKVKKIDSELNILTKKNGIGYKRIGISTGWDINHEFSFLRNLLKFDEVSVGNGWSNLGSLRYIYNDFGNKNNLGRSEAATPQIMIIKRDYNQFGSTYRGLNSEEIIISLIGDQIKIYSEININNIIENNFSHSEIIR